MMLNKKWIFLLTCIPVISFASAATFDTSTLPTLSTSLNVAKASQCTRILKMCQDPKQGPLPNDVCVQKKVKINPSCDQLQLLASKLETSPALLSVMTASQGFAIVRKSYPADGQFQNYIISSTGQIVDTRMDPRLYSTILKIQYPNKDLIVSNVDPVQSKVSLDKHMIFTTTVKVSDGCLACNILGYATSRFVFKKDGSLQTIRLMSFSKQENAQLAH